MERKEGKKGRNKEKNKESSRGRKAVYTAVESFIIYRLPGLNPNSVTSGNLLNLSVLLFLYPENRGNNNTHLTELNKTLT